MRSASSTPTHRISAGPALPRGRSAPRAFRRLPACLLAAAVLACGPGVDGAPSADAASEGNTVRILEGEVVDAACGQCLFGVPEGECELAVRIDGTVALVSGADIDAFGDAHAADGFCNAVRRALVSGRLQGGRFTASAFELLPEGG